MLEKGLSTRPNEREDIEKTPAGAAAFFGRCWGLD